MKKDKDNNITLVFLHGSAIPKEKFYAVCDNSKTRKCALRK